jgi:hypothetical protein
MAEAADSKSTSSGRRQMSPEELQIIHSTLDWRPNVHRGVAEADAADEFRADVWDRSDNFQKPTPQNSKIPILRPGELSLMHCNLNGDLDFKDMWKDISGNVRNLPNVDPMKDLWAMMGNVYDHGNYCEFLLGMYEVENKPVLDFKRMSGDGFVMDGFFRNVKKSLMEANKELIIDVEEDDGDDVFEDYSDDESVDGKDSEDNAHLTSYGYLQLSYDENLVASWIEKIKTRHVEDKNHMMGLMAYNASHNENLEIIVRKGGRDLRDLTRLLLEESNSAALVRNTSALVAAVTSVDDCSGDGYDAAFIEAIFEAMHYWVPNNGRKNTQKASATFEITESRETVANLVQTIYNLKSFVKEDDITKKANLLKDEQKSNIVAYLKKQDSSAPVDFLLHVLNTE